VRAAVPSFFAVVKKGFIGVVITVIGAALTSIFFNPEEVGMTGIISATTRGNVTVRDRPLFGGLVTRPWFVSETDSTTLIVRRSRLSRDVLSA
jgi:hypothetical protein